MMMTLIMKQIFYIKFDKSFCVKIFFKQKIKKNTKNYRNIQLKENLTKQKDAQTISSIYAYSHPKKVQNFDQQTKNWHRKIMTHFLKRIFQIRNLLYFKYHMLKALISLTLLVEVLFFSQLPYRYPKISTSEVVMDVFDGFSTGLFLGIAFFHMIPEANHKLQGLFTQPHNHQHQHQHELHNHPQHSHDVPLGALISLISFLFIMTLETYFNDEDGQHSHGHSHAQNHSSPQKQGHADDQQPNSEKRQQQKKYFESPKKITYKAYQANNVANNSPKKPKKKKRKIEVILTQIALSLHCFFQCLSIGIQQNESFVITLALAICFHKWAQALTLGYSYYEAGMALRTAMKYSLFHALLNSSAVLIGWVISSTSDTMAGIFNGVAGGTFLYVSFIEKIGKNFTEKKTIIKKIGLTMIGLAFSLMIG